MALELMKGAVRLVEAATVRGTNTVPFAGRELRFVRSRWWDDATPAMFAVEIQPYFDALAGLRSYRTVVDAGAATGQFAVSLCARMPQASVHAFEPSRRQRLLLTRNVRLNHARDRVHVWSVGLWDREATLAFRTHGAMSSIEAVSMLPKQLAFPERVRVTTLDAWVERTAPGPIDCIKMDIEGAEIEALAGARGVLARDRPDVLVQAYHIRDGRRTLERCAEMLRSLGYDAREHAAHPGLLLATAPR